MEGPEQGGEGKVQEPQGAQEKEVMERIITWRCQLREIKKVLLDIAGRTMRGRRKRASGYLLPNLRIERYSVNFIAPSKILYSYALTLN